MSEETIFDKLIKKEISADIVYEDDIAIAFRDINPQAPVHVLVIPKRKVTGFDKLGELEEEEAGKYFQTISKVAESLGLNQDGYRIVFNSGRNGQQTVNYIHAHIIGGRQMKWPPG
ncbi:MAG: histidine triad nucleotide-binding protein [Leptospiraceae bacterium]|nr:histidine triad nucleotide-binding protein [Leptospiraceae bacterium]MCP5494835.1 histidine triad nucleotide-binding protein [Leptospiraceae bacterium]